MDEVKNGMPENEETVIGETDGTDQTEETQTQTSAEETAAEEKTSRAEKKKIKKLEEELEALKAKLDESDDKYVRLFAEYDNFRRRSAKEKESIYSDAYIDALTQILPVLDNLQRAANFEGADAAALAKGLELTLKSFLDTLAKMGVSEIEAVGKTFDPNLHNAVMHVEDENLGENEVVEVFAKGYVRGDKVLRHSMVKVAN